MAAGHSRHRLGRLSPVGTVGGQEDREDRRSRLRKLQPTAVRRYQVTCEREPESGAVRTAKRSLEDVRHELVGHPDTLVSNLEHDVPAGLPGVDRDGAVAMNECVVDERRDDLRESAWRGDCCQAGAAVANECAVAPAETPGPTPPTC